MPRYDDSPRGHSPLDRRDRRIKSPMLDRRRRDSPPLPPPRITSRDHILYHHDDYSSLRPSHHSRNDYSSSAYKILCVTNISNKYPDSTVRNELVREFSRFGDPSVKLVYDKNVRLAYLYFNSYEDAREARHSKSRIMLLEKPIVIEPIYERSMPRKRSASPDYNRNSMRTVSPPIQRRLQPLPSRNSLNHDRYQLSSHSSSSSRDNYRDVHSHHHLSTRNNDHYNNSNSNNMRNQQQQRESKKEKFPNYLHHIPPEDDDKSTRTLFVGNLEVTITEDDLRRIFERYGVVEDVDVKRPPPNQGNAYAFIKFLNLDMAHRAKVEMSGQYIGKFQCKIGYGKATPTTRIWVGGLGPWTTFAQLDKEFDRFGAIRKIDYVKGDNYAYIQYDTIDAAQAACAAMRGYPLGGNDKKLRIDYADPSAVGSPPRPTNDQSNNFEFWSGDNSASPKRRRLHSPDGASDRKHSPNNTSNFDSLASHDGNRESPEHVTSSFDLSNGKSDIQVTVNENVTSVSELIKCCPPTWTGGLVLKGSCFGIRMYFCTGNLQLTDTIKENYINDKPVLRITQRLRLEPSRLEEVSKRMLRTSQYCIMIASQANVNHLAPIDVSASNGSAGGEEENANRITRGQVRPITNLVTYLKSKDAAGVVVLHGRDDNAQKCVLYLFPPHPFSIELIQKVAPNINVDESTTKEDYLVLLLSNNPS